MSVVRHARPTYELIFESLNIFREHCLMGKRSLFEPTSEVWTSEHFDELYRRFNESPDESATSFVDKLTRQLAGASDAALQLMAELMWIHFVAAGDVSGEKKREHINRVLGWMSTPLIIPAKLDKSLESGPASTGVAFNTMRPQQLWFLVNFGRAWCALTSERCADLLAIHGFKEFVYELPVESAYLQRNALLHLIHPDTFEAIYSLSHKAKIIKLRTKSRRLVIPIVSSD